MYPNHKIPVETKYDYPTENCTARTNGINPSASRYTCRYNAHPAICARELAGNRTTIFRSGIKGHACLVAR